MISLDNKRCTRCGKCIRLMKGYCISEKEGFPVFDHTLCNLCCKCAAICPACAIMINNCYPDKISNDLNITTDSVVRLLEKRRSIKHFTDKPIPKHIIEKIVSAAKYAPNQNKNISMIVIDDKRLITEIDKCAIAFVRFMYKILFGCKPITVFISLFSKGMSVIKKKMEYDLLERKHVVKENTQAVIILTGDKKVPVTENSSHYMMAAVMFVAESLEIGNCLMDSLVLTLNLKKQLRKQLNITEDVLGVLALGYSNENIVNIPRGYEVGVRWNV